MKLVPKNLFYFLVSNLQCIVEAIFLGNAKGLDNLPKPPFILAANHVSIPDGWLISGLMIKKFGMPAWFIVRDDFWLGPIWSNFVANCLGGLVIDWNNPSSILDRAREVLSSQGIIAIFPEGSRNTNTKELMLGKTGVARMALGAKCPVVPVGYFGPSIATTLDGIKNFVLKRNLANIVFGDPIDFSDYYDKTITRDVLYEITDKIMIEIGNLSNKKPILHKL